MFGSETLEVAIGLFFIYWLLSIICSALNEIISCIFSIRAKTLEKGIRNLLNDPEGTGLTKDFYNHGLIKALKKGRKNPSYIPARTFALALMDIIFPSELSHSKKIEEVRDTIAKIQNDKLKETLLILINESESKINKFRENIENWFNDSMDRVSGWYKRKVQLIIVLLAIVVSSLFNADTIMITKNLWYDSTLRAAIIATAEEAVKQPLPINQSKTNNKEKTDEVSSSKLESQLLKLEQLQQEIQSLPLPLGWYEIPKEAKDWAIKILGLLFTAVAVSLGAPFWFDLINKILKIRLAQTGKRPKGVSQEKT